MGHKPYKRFSGKHLYKVRRSANMSRLALARKIDFEVGPATIMRYESGVNVPTTNAILLIANALQVDIREFTDAES